MTLRLLPEPKELMFVKGMFSFDEQTSILLPAPVSDSARQAAGQLRREVYSSTGWDLPIVQSLQPGDRPNHVILACGQRQAGTLEIQPQAERLSAALERAGLAAGGVGSLLQPQAYTISVQRGRIVLYAEESAGLYYAVQTLRQLVRLQGRVLPTLVICDWPSLAYRGVMLDVTRGKVPTLDTLKHLIDELSHYKINVFQLYIEHTFHFPNHPRIGQDCDPLDATDIRELDAFCVQRCVELMPNLQSFGHQRHLLNLPKYEHLAETDLRWSLSPALEETYDLLADLYGDMLPAFTSKRFNVGCQEVYDLGGGLSQNLVEEAGGGYQGRGRVYLGHIHRLRDLAAQHDRRIQIWADVVLQHWDLLSELADDVTLLAWDYDPAEEYPLLERFAGTGRSWWVCPGTGSWNSLFPRLAGARTNIRSLARAGLASGAEGLLNTDWGDHGHYQHLGLSSYGYLFGADQAWTGGTTTDRQFQQAFGSLSVGPERNRVLQAMEWLDRTNLLPGVPHPNRSHTVLALFDEPLLGVTILGVDALPAATLDNMQALADAAAAVCDELADHHPRGLLLREMASAARLTGFAARKTALCQAIRGHLRQIEAEPKPVDAAANLVMSHIRALTALASELEELRDEWAALWLEQARRSQIQTALGFFDGLASRLQAAAVWLQDQRQTLLTGGTVDGELASYDPGDYRVLWQFWPD